MIRRYFQRRPTAATRFYLGLAFLLLCPTGCQNLSLFHRDPLANVVSASAKDPVVEIICLWEAAEGTGLDGLPCKGFAGQILFFTAGRSEPVRANGDVRIYVFDDLGTPEEQTRPLHEFEFGKDVFQYYMTNTNLGAAYQIFIPYTRKGGYRATCSLRVRMTTPEGRHIFSKTASLLLSGKTPDDEELAKATQPAPAASSHAIQQANYEVAAPATPDSSPSTPPNQAISLDRLNETRQSTSLSAQDRRQIKSRLSNIIQQQASTPAASETHPLTTGPR